MEDHLSPLSPDGKERSTPRIQMCAFHRRNPLRAFSQGSSEMKGVRMRSFSKTVLIAAAVVISLSSVSGQAPKKAAAPAKKTTIPHTSWGDPDLQGVWNDATS